MSSYGSIDSRCSSKCCLYRSESERPSIQQIITEGTKIDRLYLGKFLPLREKKLLTKLIKTRAIYNDVVDELLSQSDYSIAKTVKSQNTYCSCCSSDVDYTGRKIRRHGDDASRMIHEALIRRRLDRTRKDQSAPCKCDFSGCESLMRLMSKSCIKEFKHSAGHMRRSVDARTKQSLKQLRKKVRETTSGTRKQRKQDLKQTRHTNQGQKSSVNIGARKNTPRLSTSKSVALPESGSKTITRSVSADFEKQKKVKKKRLSHNKKDSRYPERCFCTLGLKSKLDKQFLSKESMTSPIQPPEKPPSISKSSEMEQKQHMNQGQSGGRQQKTKATKQQEIQTPKTSKSSATQEPKIALVTKEVESPKQVKHLKQTQAGGGVLARCMCTLKLKAKATKEATKELFSKGSMTSQHSDDRKLKGEKVSTTEDKKSDLRVKHTQESGRALKRCFCTLKLKSKATKHLLSKGSMTSYADNQTLKPHVQNRGNVAENKDRKNKGQIALPPDICDSSCIPYECYPDECLKIIKKKRQGAHIEHIPKASNTESRKTKDMGNVSTVRRPKKKISQSKVLTNKHESGDIIVSKKKSSSVSKVSTGTSKERRGSQGDVKYLGSSVHVQAEKDNKNIRVGSALKRCFCTLKLNTNDKTNKKHAKGFSRGTETPPNEKISDTVSLSKGTKTKYKDKPMLYKAPKYRSSRVETGTTPDRPRRTAVSSTTGGVPVKVKHRKHKKILGSSQTNIFQEPENEYYEEEPRETCSRQVVRISSNFSFGIEFSRETSDVRYPDGDDFCYKTGKLKGRALEPSSFNIPIPKRCFCTLDFHKGDGQKEVAKLNSKPPKIYTVSRVSVQQTRWIHGRNEESFMKNNNQFNFNAKHYNNYFTNCKSKVIRTSSTRSDTHNDKYKGFLSLNHCKSKAYQPVLQLEAKSSNRISAQKKKYYTSYENIEPSSLLHENLKINRTKPVGPFANQIFYAMNVQNTRQKLSLNSKNREPFNNKNKLKKASHEKDKSKNLVTVTSSFSLDVAFTQGKSLKPIPSKHERRSSTISKLLQKAKNNDAVKCLCSLITKKQEQAKKDAHKCLCTLMTKEQEKQAKKDAQVKAKSQAAKNKAMKSNQANKAKIKKSKSNTKELCMCITQDNTKNKDRTRGTKTDPIKEDKKSKAKTALSQRNEIDKGTNPCECVDKEKNNKERTKNTELSSERKDTQARGYSETRSLRSTTSNTFMPHTKQKYKPKLSRNNTITLNKEGKNKTITKNAKERQAVQIDSAFSLSVEFTRNQIHEGAEIQSAAEILKQKRIAARVKRQPGVNQGIVTKPDQRFVSSQVDRRIIKNRGASTKTYDTVKLQKQGYVPAEEVKIVKHKGVGQHQPEKAELNTRSCSTDIKSPFECKLGVCIPGKCYPPDCYKLIHGKLHRDVGTATKKRSKHHRNETSTIMKHAQQETKCYANSQAHSGRMIVEEPRFKRQAVRIGSHFNFNVEFFKDYAVEEKIPANTGIKIQKNRYNPENKSNFGMETQITSSEKGITPLLKRCFCLKNKAVPVYAVTNVTRPRLFTNELKDQKKKRSPYYQDSSVGENRRSLSHGARKKTSYSKEDKNWMRVRNIDSRVLMDKLRSTLIKVQPFVKRCFSTIPLHLITESVISTKQSYNKSVPSKINRQEKRDKSDRQNRDYHFRTVTSRLPANESGSALQVITQRQRLAAKSSRKIRKNKMNLNAKSRSKTSVRLACKPVKKGSLGDAAFNKYSLQHLTSVPEQGFQAISQAKQKYLTSRLSQSSMKVQMKEIESNIKRSQNIKYNLDKDRSKFSISDAKHKFAANQFDSNHCSPNKCYSYEMGNHRIEGLLKDSRYINWKESRVSRHDNRLNIDRSPQQLIKNKFKSRHCVLRHTTRSLNAANSGGPCGDGRLENPPSFRIESGKNKYKDRSNKKNRILKIVEPRNDLKKTGVGNFFKRALNVFIPKQPEKDTVKTATKVCNGVHKRLSAHHRKQNLKSNECVSITHPQHDVLKQQTRQYLSRSTHLAEVVPMKAHSLARQAPVYRSKRTLYKDRNRKESSHQEIIKELLSAEFYNVRHGVTFKSSLIFLNTDQYYKYQKENRKDLNGVNKRHVKCTKKYNIQQIKGGNINHDRRSLKAHQEIRTPSRQATKTNYIKKILKDISNTFRQTKKGSSPIIRKVVAKSQPDEKNKNSMRLDFIVARAAIEENIPPEINRTRKKIRQKTYSNSPKENIQSLTRHSKHHNRKNIKYSTINCSEEIKTIYPYVQKKIKTELGNACEKYALKRYKSELRPQKQRYNMDEKPLRRVVARSKNIKKHVHKKPTKLKNQKKCVKSSKNIIFNMLWNIFKFNKPLSRIVKDKTSARQKNKSKKYTNHKSYDIMNKKYSGFQDENARKRNYKSSLKQNNRLTCLYLQAEYDRDHGKLKQPNYLAPAADIAMEPKCCCNKQAPCPPGPAGANVHPCPNVESPDTNVHTFKSLLEPSNRKSKRLSLTPYKTLPPGTTLPPYDAGSQKPLFEMRLKAGTLDLVNSDEVYGQISKLNKLSANRARDYLRQLKKLHGEGCCCCICKAVKAKVNEEESKAAEARKKECIEKKRKERDLRAKSLTEWIMQKRRKPCICGIKKCMREKDIMTELEILRYRGLLTKPCVCGTKICAAEWAKKLASMKGVKGKDVERRKKEISKKKIQERKVKEYRERLKIYKKEDKAVRKYQKAFDKEQMKNAKKSVKYGDVAIAVDSAMDVGKTGFKNIFGLIGCFFKKLFHPWKEAKSVGHRLTDPGPRIKAEAQNLWIGSGVGGTSSRTYYRVGRMTCVKTLRTKLETHPLGIYLVVRDPQRRHALLKEYETKKRLQQAITKREPTDFQCSLFMASLRKRPFLKVYFTCPWFYPHCISLLGIARTLMEAGLFCLAMIVWSPCILAMECCRAVMCCTTCTG